jgi:hypothetical protein
MANKPYYCREVRAIRQKDQTNLTRDRARFQPTPEVGELIALVNAIDEISDEEWQKMERYDPFDVFHRQNLCKCVHQIAQIANLPDGNMQEEYAKAVVGTEEEWERFCQRLPVKPWRKWANLHAGQWRWPWISYELVISDDGLIVPSHHFRQIAALENIEAKRLRECQKCQRIFWTSRIEKKGGPYGCGPECNNVIYQRNHRERARVAARDRERAK